MKSKELRGFVGAILLAFSLLSGCGQYSEREVGDQTELLAKNGPGAVGPDVVSFDEREGFAYGVQRLGSPAHTSSG